MIKKNERSLEKIFQKIFKKKVNVKNLKRINEEKWDSLAHVNLIVAIESEFKLRLKPHQIENMNSFKSILMLIKKNK
jgi:acyl carrier protein|tara:strand:+ start:117 stop:347 length:231 start_codon:yes stop_codon:yes gene_type:complete